MNFGTLISAALGLWLLSCGTSTLALCWNAAAAAWRRWAALASAGAGIFTAYLGLSQIHLTASQTVDGQLRWKLDSSWFFTAALILGVAALALNLWHRVRAGGRRDEACPDAHER